MGYPGPFPFKVEQGGTGEISLAANAVLIGQNPDDITVTNVGTDGQLLIGATSGPPAFATLTSTGSTITFTPGPNALNLEAGGSVAITFDADTGTATPSSNTITFAGGSGISTSATGSTVTITATGVGITTIDGDTGTITGSTVSVKTNSFNGAFGTPKFIGNNAADMQLVFSTLTNSNTGIGLQSLASLLNGFNNIALGDFSGEVISTGSLNCCIGVSSGVALTSGSSNFFFGASTGGSIVSGSNSIMIGTTAGQSNVTGTESNDIYLNSLGVNGESNALRIGNATGSGMFQLNKAYICGIDGVDLSTAELVTMASDQLGSTTLTAGSGISITPGAGVLTIAATGGGSITINGDTSSVSGSTLNIVTGYTSGPNTNGTLRFDGDGSTTLTLNTSDSNSNTGFGNLAFASIAGTSAVQNNVFGRLAGATLGAGATAGSQNCLYGFGTGGSIDAGSHNCAYGNSAIDLLVSGNFNCAFGHESGSNLTGAESSNIYINSLGVVSESNTLRIGQATGTTDQNLSTAYICGIDGVNVGSVAKVLTMASDQIGTATITAGSGITVTPTANTITIATTGSTSFPWTEVTGASQSMAVNNGYILNNAGLVTATLPATAAVGDVVRVSGKGTGGWRIAQNSGQTIFFGVSTTTTGATGHLDSSARRDGIELLCVTANNDWNVLSSIGNISYT